MRFFLVLSFLSFSSILIAESSVYDSETMDYIQICDTVLESYILNYVGTTTHDSCGIVYYEPHRSERKESAVVIFENPEKYINYTNFYLDSNNNLTDPFTPYRLEKYFDGEFWYLQAFLKTNTSTGDSPFIVKTNRMRTAEQNNSDGHAIYEEDPIYKFYWVFGEPVSDFVLQDNVSYVKSDTLDGHECDVFIETTELGTVTAWLSSDAMYRPIYILEAMVENDTEYELKVHINHEEINGVFVPVFGKIELANKSGDIRSIATYEITYDSVNEYFETPYFTPPFEDGEVVQNVTSGDYEEVIYSK